MGDGERTPATESTLLGEAQPDPKGLKPGALLAGRYRLVRFIAKGGMGEVYEAEDLALGEHVALKTIRRDGVSPKLLDRFMREIQLAVATPLRPTGASSRARCAGLGRKAGSVQGWLRSSGDLAGHGPCL